MTKIISRILIIGLIIGGGLYLLLGSNEEANVTDNEKDNKVENKVENDDENLTFEIKKGKTKKEVLDTAQKAFDNSVKNTENSNTQKSITLDKIAEIQDRKITQNVSKFIEGLESTDLTVYLYEYRVDLSAKEIPAGNVNFRVVNTGRLSHNLTLKDGGGQVMFGRVAPGKTEYFKANISKSELEVLSIGRIDEKNNMSESLTIN